MTTVGYARVSSTGQDLTVQLEKLAGCDKVFKEKRSGVDAGRPALKACLEYLREGDTLLVTKLDRLARSTRIASFRTSPREASPSKWSMTQASTPLRGPAS
jgi:DNA invertase Pin-like site-specific DNA recombinase